MSYLVLARKYRPQVFEDMVGQEHLIKTLKNAITGGRVAHAYLFCGPRGVGKTTAARILAKALNCEKGPAPVPCNTCEACVEITEGRSMDVLEIDGASNRGINEVRELRENTRYAPARGRSKVYIIDEVHMLTNEAFNALLKTLEEPPEHVVFVFATTEPFKVPGTILSRCQRFDFARIPARRLGEHLAAIAESESIEVSAEAISLVARRAQGGVRDALSLMDQIISAAEGKIERESVERFLGMVGADFYFALADRIAEGDAAGSLELLNTTYNEGADLGDLSEGLAFHWRDLLLVRLSDDLIPLLDAADSDVSRLKTQAAKFDRDTLVDLADRAAELAPAVRRSEHPRLTLELCLAEMAELPGRATIGELTRRLLELEKRLGGSAPAPGSGPARRSPAGTKPAPRAGAKPSSRTRAEPEAGTRPPKTSEAAKAPPEPETSSAAAPSDVTEIWERAVAAVKKFSMRLGSTLQAAEAVSFSSKHGLILRPAAPNPLLDHCLAEPETRKILGEVLAQLGCVPASVVMEGQEPPAADPEKEGSRDAGEEPEASEGKTEGKSTDERSMGEIFKDEPMLQKALDMFDGEVLP